jgi:hypothetical protein
LKESECVIKNLSKNLQTQVASLVNYVNIYGRDNTNPFKIASANNGEGTLSTSFYDSSVLKPHNDQKETRYRDSKTESFFKKKTTDHHVS